MAQYYQGLIVEPDCGRCPLKFDRKVLPDGPVPAKICFVGEGPGWNEVEQGRGFVGASGILLWQLAGAYGVKREDIWVSNATLCMPRVVKLSTGAVLQKPQVVQLAAAACRRRLIGELLCVTEGRDDAVVTAIGTIALQALSKRKGGGVYAYRGSLLQVDLRALWQEVNQGR